MASVEERRRHRAVAFAAGVAVLLFLFFTVDNVRRGGVWVQVGAVYALGGVLAAGALLARATSAYLWLARLCLAYCCATNYFSFFFAPEAFTFAWTVFAPAAAIVLFGPREGCAWAGFLWLLWAMLLFRPDAFGIDPTGSDWPSFDRSIAVLVVLVLVTALTAGYEASRLRTLGALEAEAEARVRAEQEQALLARVAGGLAHEMNNGLLVLQGNLDLAEPTGAADGSRAASEAMRVAIRELHALGDRLLTATGQQRLRPVETDLRSIVEAAVSRMPAGRATVVELDAALPPVRIDPERLVDVLEGLLVNAREVDDGELAVRARTVTLDRPAAGALQLASGTYVLVSVLDRGPGFAPEVLERALEPYFTTRIGTPGRGLGLTMVRGFLRQSGGAVRLRNRARGGAAVDLWLLVA